MAIDFPNSPTNGQTYTAPGTGQTWTYELATNSWTATSLATTGGLVYKGSVDITAAPPTNPKAGEQWSVSTGGAAHVAYGPGVTGAITKGSMVMYTGTGWIETSHSVPDATDAAKGVVELATPAETTTGTDGSRAVTPAGLKVELDKKANLASPALTGIPTAPTAAAGTNTTQLATTEFVKAATPDATSTAKGLVQLADAAAITAGTAGRAVDAAQLKAAVAVENLWDRAGTTVSPVNAGDAVDIDFPLGTEALPGLTPVGFPKSGFYSPGSDQIAIATNGQQAFMADAVGRCFFGGDTTVNLPAAMRELLAVLTNAAFSVGVPGAVPFGVGPVPPSGTAFAGLGIKDYSPVHLASGSFC